MWYPLQHLAPQKLLTKFAGFLARNQTSWLKNLLIKYFLFKFPTTNMSEAQKEDPYSYTSFNDLFTRRLKINARDINHSNSALISPADGVISQIGSISASKILQAKGHFFSVDSLLANNSANHFTNGSFATIYLSPPDYHRVHMPTSAKLEQMIYIPGRLFSVNQSTTANVKGLFSRNERVVNIFNTPHGKMAVILVGAMLVGHIGLCWEGIINQQHAKHILSKNYLDENITLNKGEEVGYFQMGSTVILLLENNFNCQWLVSSQQTVKVGQQIGGI